MVLKYKDRPLRQPDTKINEKFPFYNFGIIKKLLTKSTKGNPEIMVLWPQNLPLRLKDAKFDLKILIYLFFIILVALSQIENEKSNNHGAET